MKKDIDNFDSLFSVVENNFETIIKQKDLDKITREISGHRSFFQRDLYITLFGVLPNHTRIEKLNTTKALRWLFEEYKSQINGFSFNKCDVDLYQIDFDILTYNDIFIFLKNNMMIHLITNSNVVAICFTENLKQEAFELETKLINLFYMDEVEETKWKIEGYQRKLNALLAN